jgi:hypothetical protein
VILELNVNPYRRAETAHNRTAARRTKKVEQTEVE